MAWVAWYRVEDVDRVALEVRSVLPVDLDGELACFRIETVATVRVSVRATERDELTVDVVALQETPERSLVLCAALSDVFSTQEERNVTGCIARVLVLDACDILGRDPIQRDVCGLARLPGGSVEERALGGAEVLADLRCGLRYVARLLDAGHWQHEQQGGHEHAPEHARSGGQREVARFDGVELALQGCLCSGPP